MGSRKRETEENAEIGTNPKSVRFSTNENEQNNPRSASMATLPTLVSSPLNLVAIRDDEQKKLKQLLTEVLFCVFA